MSTVAEQLRAAREARKLTVQQVADATKIRTDHVRALEDGDFSVFSAPIYIRGSVKLYATLLKLELPPLMSALDIELAQTEKYSEPPPLSQQRKTILDELTLIMAKVNWKLGLTGLAVIGVGLVLVLSILTWRHQQKNDPLKNLPPARYEPANSGETLPLPKK
jgi:cytoskeletal protein RodZ